MSPEHWPIENKAGRAVVRGGLSEAKILCKHQFLLTYQTVLEFWFVFLFFLLWIDLFSLLEADCCRQFMKKKKKVKDYKTQKETQKETHGRECLIFPEGEMSKRLQRGSGPWVES